MDLPPFDDEEELIAAVHHSRNDHHFAEFLFEIFLYELAAAIPQNKSSTSVRFEVLKYCADVAYGFMKSYDVDMDQANNSTRKLPVRNSTMFYDMSVATAPYAPSTADVYMYLKDEWRVNRLFMREIELDRTKTIPSQYPLSCTLPALTKQDHDHFWNQYSKINPEFQDRFAIIVYGCRKYVWTHEGSGGECVSRNEMWAVEKYTKNFNARRIKQQQNAKNAAGTQASSSSSSSSSQDAVSSPHTSSVADDETAQSLAGGERSKAALKKAKKKAKKAAAASNEAVDSRSQTYCGNPQPSITGSSTKVQSIPSSENDIDKELDTALESRKKLAREMIRRGLDSDEYTRIAGQWALQHSIVMSSVLQSFNNAEEKRRAALEIARRKAIKACKDREAEAERLQVTLKRVCRRSLEINTALVTIRNHVEKARAVALTLTRKEMAKQEKRIAKEKKRKDKKAANATAMPTAAALTAAGAAGTSSKNGASSSTTTSTSVSATTSTSDSSDPTTKAPTLTSASIASSSSKKPPSKDQTEVIDIFLDEYVKLVASRLQPMAPGPLPFMLMAGIRSEIRPQFMSSWDSSKSLRMNVNKFLDKSVESEQVTSEDAYKLMEYYDDIPADRKKRTPWEMGGIVAGGAGGVGMGSWTYGSWGMGGGDLDDDDDVYGFSYDPDLDLDYNDDDTDYYSDTYLKELQDEGRDDKTTGKKKTDDSMSKGRGAVEDSDGSETDNSVPDWETVTEDENSDDDDDESESESNGEQTPVFESAVEDNDDDGSADDTDDDDSSVHSSDVPDWETVTEDEDNSDDDGGGGGNSSNKGSRMNKGKGVDRTSGSTDKKSGDPEGDRIRQRKAEAAKNMRNREKAERFVADAIAYARATLRETSQREQEEDAKKEAERARALVIKEKAERAAKEEAERLTKEKAERAAKEEAERAAKEEAERAAKEEAERAAKEEAERAAKEEAERIAREEAERIAREEAEQAAKEEAERAAREEAERIAREKAEQAAREEAERAAREKAERIAREESERAAKEEAERMTREEEERTTGLKAELVAKEEAERVVRKNAEGIAEEGDKVVQCAREVAKPAVHELTQIVDQRLRYRITNEEVERLIKEDKERVAQWIRAGDAKRIDKDPTQQLATSAANGALEDEAVIEEADIVTVGSTEDGTINEQDQAIKEFTERVSREQTARAALAEAEKSALLIEGHQGDAAKALEAFKAASELVKETLREKAAIADQELKRLRVLSAQKQEAAKEFREQLTIEARILEFKNDRIQEIRAVQEAAKAEAYLKGVGTEGQPRLDANEQRQLEDRIAAIKDDRIQEIESMRSQAEAIWNAEAKTASTCAIKDADAALKAFQEAVKAHADAQSAVKNEKATVKNELRLLTNKVNAEIKEKKRQATADRERVKSQVHREAAALAKSRGEPVRIPNNDAVYYDWRGINLMLSLWKAPTEHYRNMEPLVEHHHTILRPTEQSMMAREYLLQRLQHAFDLQFPSAGLRLMPFGSYVTGLGNLQSDIDICVYAEHYDPFASHSDVSYLAEILRLSGLKEVRAITDAKVPIIKFVDPVTEIACDMNVQHPLGIYNSGLIKAYLDIDVRLGKFLFVLKYFAKTHGILDGSSGFLCSYAYILMAIVFFQGQKEPILPRLQSKNEKPKSVNDQGKSRKALPTFGTLLRDGIIEQTYVQQDGKMFDCTYDSRVDLYRSYGLQNKKTVSQLLFEFFEYFARRFDYRTMEVSSLHGRIQERHAIVREKRQQLALAKLTDSSTSSPAPGSFNKCNNATPAYTFDSKKQLWLSEADKAFFQDLESNNGVPSGTVPVPGSSAAAASMVVNNTAASASPTPSVASTSTSTSTSRGGGGGGGGGYQDRFGSEAFLCVMDPFIVTRNVAGTCRGERLRKVWMCFDHAYKCFALGQFEAAFTPLSLEEETKTNL
ncbi:Zinc finger, CCHC domain-containing protein [Mortierella sp. GBA30]|nr:Zinc finger, CCHC domain-containing protein [Mortierella sp. GBA30]